jgi:hypothetical protein
MAVPAVPAVPKLYLRLGIEVPIPPAERVEFVQQTCFGPTVPAREKS